MSSDSTSGLELDAGAWPIVHGSPESLDYTTHPTPTTAALRFYNTQGLDPSSPSSSDDADEMRIGMGDAAASLLAALQRAVVREGLPLGLLGALESTRPQKSFSMADANPVSIITERVADGEQRL